MTSVKPLYDHVRATVLEGLRREWQRYGWEDSEIDDKVDKLAKLWAAALHNTGAVTDTPQPSQQQEAAAEEKKDEDGVDGKRKRKREDKPGEKRFKSGPRVDAPLTYPTFPPASTTAAAGTSTQPAALASGYVPRFSSPSPSPLPQTLPTTAAAPAVPQMMQTDGSGETPNPPPPHSPSQPSPAAPLLTTSVSTSTSSVPPTSSHSPIKPEQPLPPPLPLAPFTASSSFDNPLLTEPLSVLDDDSDVEIELSGVKDVILCQYERVQHQKGRWKVAMRDGIVSVKGKEYAFSRLTGELQW